MIQVAAQTNLLDESDLTRGLYAANPYSIIRLLELKINKLKIIYLLHWIRVIIANH